MNTKLIFFDSFQNSIKGIKRGLIAFIIFILFDLVRFSITNNTPNNIYAMIFIYLLLYN